MGYEKFFIKKNNSQKGDAMTKIDKDIFFCYAIGNKGLCHAWGKGKTQQEAIKECELAVKESIVETPSKHRHRPYAYIVGHDDWWSLKKQIILNH